MLDKSGSLIWYQCDGPLLLLPEEYLTYWEGIDSPSGGRNIHANFRWSDPDAPATDYDRACDINDYLGLVAVGSGKGLVLNDMPMATAWLAAEGDKVGGTLIRWMHAESDAEVVQALDRAPRDVWQPTGLIFDVLAQPLYLFDATLNGNDLSMENCLIIQIEASSYSIATALYEPDSNTSLVLHLLMPVTPG